MGRVIRNQRKGRGSIFSECDRIKISILAQFFSSARHERNEENADGLEEMDQMTSPGIGALMIYFSLYSGQHPSQQGPRPVPYP